VRAYVADRGEVSMGGYGRRERARKQRGSREPKTAQRVYQDSPGPRNRGGRASVVGRASGIVHGRVRAAEARVEAGEWLGMQTKGSALWAYWDPTDASEQRGYMFQRPDRVSKTKSQREPGGGGKGAGREGRKALDNRHKQHASLPLTSATSRCSLCTNAGRRHPVKRSTTYTTRILHMLTIPVPRDVKVESAQNGKAGAYSHPTAATSKCQSNAAV
jgi:hypothetical protein